MAAEHFDQTRPIAAEGGVSRPAVSLGRPLHGPGGRMRQAARERGPEADALGDLACGSAILGGAPGADRDA